MPTVASGQGGGGDDLVTDVEVSLLKPPSIVDVRRALQRMVEELQLSMEASPPAPADETARPAPRTPDPASAIDVACTEIQDTARQQLERQRLLRLAEWAQRLAEGFERTGSGTVPVTAACVGVVKTSKGVRAEEVNAHSDNTSLPPAEDSREERSEAAAAATVTGMTPKSEVAVFASGSDSVLPSVRDAEHPVERRLSYPAGYTNAHAPVTMTCSANPDAYHGLSSGAHPATATHSPSPLSWTPPSIIPCGRATLCRVMGPAYDVPTTRAKKCAVLASQGGCCGRCGVVLPPPPFLFCQGFTALLKRMRARLTFSCGHGGCWRACMRMWRCSSSDDEGDNESPEVVNTGRVTQDRFRGAGGNGFRGSQNISQVPCVPSESDENSCGDYDEGSHAASERDGLLASGAALKQRVRTPTTRQMRSSSPFMTSAPLPRSDVSRPGGKRGAGGNTVAHAPLLFCAYEGRYLCERCFHAPLAEMDRCAAISAAVSGATASDTHGALIPPGCLTRYVKPEEWQKRDASTSNMSLSLARLQSRWRSGGDGGRADGGTEISECAACPAYVGPSDLLQKGWLVRHLAQPTPTGSTHCAVGGTGAGHTPPPQLRQHTVPQLHSCVIPAHVLHRWDFTRLPVSAAAAATLQRQCCAGNISNREDCPSGGAAWPELCGHHTTRVFCGTSRVRSEGAQVVRSGERQDTWGLRSATGGSPPTAPLPLLYDVSVINPSLYMRIPALASASRLRKRMSLLHAQAWWCLQYRREVWGLQGEDAITGQLPEGAPAVAEQQQPAPLSTGKHTTDFPPHVSTGLEKAVSKAEVNPPANGTTSPHPSPWTARSNGVTTPQTPSGPAPPHQNHSSLPGRTAECASPYHYSPAMKANAAAGPSPTRGRCTARRRYLVERADGWSLQDLCRLVTPSSQSCDGTSTGPSMPPLLLELQNILLVMQAHVNDCCDCAPLCSGLLTKAPLGSSVYRV